MAWLFIVFTFLIFHTYGLYLASLLLLDTVSSFILRWQKVCNPPKALEGEVDFPTISIVTAAYNEEKCILEKIENSFQLDYPHAKIEVIIGSDGSTDRTEEIIRSVKDSRLKLLVGPRSGKSSVLNRCVDVARGDIVILTDANTRIEKDAVKKLVSCFRDKRVGAVSGRLVLSHPTDSTFKESTYWRYETMLKIYEGRLGVLVGANGGFYAVRKRLFEPLAPEIIVDDFVISMRVLSHGYKVSFASDAIAHEFTAEKISHEYQRRVRIAAGNFQALKLFPYWLWKGTGLQLFAFWSHKVLRWTGPFSLAMMFVSNLMMFPHGWGWRLFFFVQVAFYFAAFIGKYISKFSLPYYFVSMNWAMVVGLFRCIRRAQPAAWEKTPRIAV